MTAAKATPASKRRVYQKATSTMGRIAKNKLSSSRLAKCLAASMRARCFVLAALAYTTWFVVCWMSTNVPLRHNRDNYLRKGPKEIDRPVHATEDDYIAQRLANESVAIDDSKTIHLKYEKEGINKVYTTNARAGQSKTLRERLLERSLEAKDRISQMLLNAVAPAENPRYVPYLNPRTLTENTNRSCEQMDAFVGIPIDGDNGRPWHPPKAFPTDSIRKWNNEYKAAMRKIKEASFGGIELRELGKVEVQRLRALRHSLFCGEL
ncbi:hypothetical protein ACHAW5_000727 [Stephanodiscus triporus]|uniref:Uncharacterized protein n=1 Tax=Stephanodiscus triporus TaxID=2934178 RepID=A0ABD3N170_9STRA